VIGGLVEGFRRLTTGINKIIIFQQKSESAPNLDSIRKRNNMLDLDLGKEITE
jgi:molybdopterin-guanine dinucleotide biosynthesis protein